MTYKLIKREKIQKGWGGKKYIFLHVGIEVKSLPLLQFVKKTHLDMDTLLFNTRDELIRVSLRHVVYFEADGNYTHIFFANAQKATILYSLTRLETLLDEKLQGKKQPFIRIGKKYIINSTCVFQINIQKHKLLLTNFDTSNVFTLSISKDALKSLKEIYTAK